MTFIEPFGGVQMCHLVMLACQHRTKEDFPVMLAGQRASTTFILPSCGYLLLVYSMVFLQFYHVVSIQPTFYPL